VRQQGAALASRTGAALVALALGALVLAPRSAHAHDFKPALLALTERAPGVYDVVWRIPIEAAADRLSPIFPEGTVRSDRGTRVREGDSVVERFTVRRPGGLGGAPLRLGGASAAITEVLVRAELGPGNVVTGRLRAGPAGASFDLPRAPSRAGMAATYLRLGVEHILTGVDHLAFVLALVLLAGTARAIVRAVTAFTAAHSVTLVAAALGLAHVPQPPVEATIALSIMFVARELALRRAPSWDPALPPRVQRGPAAVAFGFGLLHGLGFAGALAEVGLPAGDIPLSLFCFNLGVELGQLGFVLLVLGAARLLRPRLASLAQRGPRWVQARAWLEAAPATAIGTLGAFWLIDRVTGFFR
jgi:hydrogenase/urease accessory protein HupE